MDRPQSWRLLVKLLTKTRSRALAGAGDHGAILETGTREEELVGGRN